MRHIGVAPSAALGRAIPRSPRAERWPGGVGAWVSLQFSQPWPGKGLESWFRKVGSRPPQRLLRVQLASFGQWSNKENSCFFLLINYCHTMP